MSTYLITGGLGGIGSHLFEHLQSLGHKLVIVDKQVYGKRSQYVLTELRKKYGHVNYSEMDMCHFEELSDFLVNNYFDGIFHLAALPSHRISLAYPYEFFQNDLQVTVNLLEVVRKYCPKTNIVFSSTNKVYSDKEMVVTESSLIDLKGPYAISKYQSEQWCNFYVNRFGLKVNIARLFHVVGSRMQPHRETPLFVDKIAKGLPVDLHGKFNLDQTFESTYFGYTNVHDTVAGLWLMMQTLQNGSIPSLYNIGASEKIRVEDIIKYIAEKMGRIADINRVQILEHETIGCVADSSKIAALGWKPESDVWSAISEYVDWHLKMIGEIESGQRVTRGVLI